MIEPDESTTVNFVIEALESAESGSYSVDYRVIGSNNSSGMNSGFHFTLLEKEEVLSPDCRLNYSISIEDTPRIFQGISGFVSFKIINNEELDCNEVRTFNYNISCPENWKCESTEGDTRLVPRNDSKIVTLRLKPATDAKPKNYTSNIEAGYGNTTRTEQFSINLRETEDRNPIQPDYSNPVDWLINTIESVTSGLLRVN
jgi:uncharacterized membrane protein